MYEKKRPRDEFISSGSDGWLAGVFAAAADVKLIFSVSSVAFNE